MKKEYIIAIVVCVVIAVFGIILIERGVGNEVNITSGSTNRSVDLFGDKKIVETPSMQIQESEPVQPITE